MKTDARGYLNPRSCCPLACIVSCHCIPLYMLQCMPPAYLPLRCPNGECGHILQGQASSCPSRCSLKTQCHSCLTVPGCGWCSLKGVNGFGICMKGGFMGPLEGLCTAKNISYYDEPLPGMLSSISYT